MQIYESSIRISGHYIIEHGFKREIYESFHVGIGLDQVEIMLLECTHIMLRFIMS
jgi:hypothetical protein